MNTKLIAKAAHLDHFDRESGLARYLSLLSQPTHSDTEVLEFNKLLKSLGKTTAEAFADVSTIHKAEELAARIERARGIAAVQDDVARRLVKFLADREVTLRQLKEMHIAIEVEQQAAGSVYGSGRKAIFDLRDMKLANGPLLVGVPLPTEEEFEKIAGDSGGKNATTVPTVSAAG